LRAAIETAKEANMPKGNISRAISKSEMNKNENFQNLRYEGFGPKNIALILETLTDNKNRTAGKIRMTLQKFGGNLGTSGSSVHFFDNCGIIQITKKDISDEKALDFATTIGALDCVSYVDFHEIVSKKEDFYKIKNESQKLVTNLMYSGIEWRPKNPISLKKEETLDLENMLELLQEDDDIQNVFHNCKFL
jgi:Uncharacterized conserved protein